MSWKADPTVGEIPRDWNFTTLGEICSAGDGFVQTGPFGSQLHASDYVEVGIPSIMPVNIGDNRTIEVGIKCVSPSDADRLSRHRVQPGDIVFSRRGDVERRALIREAETGWLCGTGCLLVRLGNSAVDPTFASYYLAHPDVRRWIARHAVGSTMPNLNTRILSSVPFAVPPLSEQRTIARILGSLDDKIELNRQMNHTLEASAQAIFRSWFVDFDPVLAKVDGRKPFAMAHNVAALFPDRFLYSELGPIPEGWEWRPVSEALMVNPTRSLEKGELAPYVGMADVPIDSAIPWSWDEREYGSGVRFTRGDTLLAKITPCLENGKTAYVGFLKAGEVGWGSTEFIVLASKGSMPSEFPYFLARLEEFRVHVIANMTGSSGRQRVPVAALNHFEIAIPADPILQAFGELSSPIMEKLVLNVKEAQTLAALRDTLIPKLLSGEIRVGETESAVEGGA